MRTKGQPIVGVKGWDRVPDVFEYRLAAEMFGYNPTYLRKLIAEGSFPGFHRGKKIFCIKSEVMAWCGIKI